MSWAPRYSGARSARATWPSVSARSPPPVMRPSDPRSAGAWYAAGALSDALDVAVTVAAWPRLPRGTRWLVAASAGGAAIAGAAGTIAAFLE